jgi:two-component sensor histidine kinase
MRHRLQPNAPELMGLSCCVLLWVALGVACLAGPASYDDLRAGFSNPPDSARPQTWWHWMNGNITREGITADLEAMRQIGLGGATVVNVDCGIPPGPVKFMSPEWRELFKFAAQEAGRLGLELCVENCAGWSSSGGPWNTPANAMQRLTSSETNLHGPTTFDGVLPQPPTNLNYYREIAVLAFKASTSNAKASLEDSSGKFQVRRALYETDNGRSADVTPIVVDRIRRHEKSMTVSNGELGGDPAEGQRKRLRLEFTLDGKPDVLLVDENETVVFPLNASLLALARSKEKSSVNRTFVQPARPEGVELTEPISQNDILNLTGGLAADGRLHWVVPPGDWVVVRFGYTPIGINNHPAPKEGKGLECDKLSKAALDAHWNGFMQKILDDLGPLAPRSLNASLIDSYETGKQDWTENFREEFEQRRGYDPLKFLLTFTHRVVDSPEISERFLWDMRRTVADLFAENYYGHFAELCRRHGLLSAVEPYGGPFEALQCGAPADVVMGEFWTGSQGHPSVKLAASIAHTYGKTVVGAESFTTGEQEGRWQNDPYSLKALGDLMFCQGLNRCIFHRYALQPWTNRWPGMTMGEYGLHFERTQTWWPQATEWIAYLTRCQFLLQQGRPVADVACFTGESAPMEMPGAPAMPAGYDLDAVNADVLLHRAHVEADRITLPGGASYAALVLPPGEPAMTPQLLQRIAELVRAGATVVGQPPRQAPGLEGYRKRDARVKTMAGELWGKCDGRTVFENRFGKGRVVWGKSLADLLAAQNLTPDFESVTPSNSSALAFAHRLAGETDIYFVANQLPRFRTVECTFRVGGKVPELWHADTGICERAPIWSEKDTRTTVRLNFDPAGSVFVVFRAVSNTVDHLQSVRGDLALSARNFAASQTLEVKRAVYAAVDGHGEADVTARLSDLARAGQLVVVASNAALGSDPATNHVKQLRVDYVLDGQSRQITVRENETLTIPPAPITGPGPSWVAGITPDGGPFVRAWNNGRLTFTSAGGKSFQSDVTGLPSPKNISSGWTLSFPPGSGAPQALGLDKLVSWTDFTNDDARYFSGTAVYEKEIDITPGQLAVGRELWLDLGIVKNLAQVSLNGQSLGVFWKPPFKLNLTAAAKVGRNMLAVKVTNLWPNRLIGDEQLPADCEWDGNRLKAWPRWLLEGKPSPAGRHTFATWRYYRRDSPVLESGLLGPVELQEAEVHLMTQSMSDTYINPTNWLGSWIWDKSTFNGQTCQFWRSFQIPKGVKVTKARVAVTADDEFTLFLDGHQLGRGADWRELYDFDFLASFLPPGNHVLAVKAFNSFHSAGMILGVHIELSDGRFLDFKSDQSWRLVPNEVKNFANLTRPSGDWRNAVVQAPMGADPWVPFPVSVDRMPALQPQNIFFWQTGWFQITLSALCSLAVLFSLRLMAQLALHRKERLLLQQERARIAREIHDDIGARMTQLVLHGEVAQNELANSSEIREQLVQLCDEARSLLSTMDEILWAVNPQRDGVRDFASFVCDYAQEFLRNTPIQCLFEIDNDIPETALDLPTRRSLLMAIKEALNNAVKYSKATELRLKIHQLGQRLVVTVEDNGQGFDTAALKPGRNGLANMFQRMKEIGGRRQLTTRPGGGCRLEFSVPLHRSTRPTWKWLASAKNIFSRNRRSEPLDSTQPGL